MQQKKLGNCRYVVDILRNIFMFATQKNYTSWLFIIVLFFKNSYLYFDCNKVLSNESIFTIYYLK